MWYKKIIYTVCAIAIIIILLSVMMWLYTFHWPLIRRGESVAIKLYPNTGIEHLADTLQKQRLLSNKKWFIFGARLTGDAKKLRFGQYWIRPGMTANDLLNNMTTGQGLVRHHITFVEGWTFDTIKNTLAANKDLDHVINGKSDKAIMHQLNAKFDHPEGLFFPDTYYFTWGKTDLSVLSRAYEKMQMVLRQEWKSRAKWANYQRPYQALIVASLIEKESAIKKERPIISGIILNRWHKGIRLQIDPTILYGVGKPYGSVITRQDLRTKTPYNTYLNYGLPPTPICMPSADAIDAAMHPLKTDYLYFVAKGDGSHIFSKTYQQHRKAVKLYRKEQQQLKNESNLIPLDLDKKTMQQICSVIIITLQWLEMGFSA